MARELGLLREPDPAAERRARMFLMAVLVALLLRSSIQWYMERDLVTGSQGPFPAALGSEAPAAPTHAAHRSYRPEALVHGLAVDLTDSGVRALNLRTGKEYWRYERRDADADMPSVEVSADTVVAWFDDGRLVGIDLRTGSVRWRTDFARHGFQDLHIGAGQVVAQTPGGVAAFSERGGQRLWRLKQPRSCRQPVPWAAYDMAEHLTAVELNCGNSDGLGGVVIGVDNRTGAALWKRAVRQELYKGDDHTLIAVAPTETGRPGEAARVQILDVDRQGAEPRAEFTGDDWAPTSAQDGVIINDAGDEPRDSAHSTVLTAYDTQVGERAWERRAAAGHSFGSLRIADGRVYVVENSTVLEEYEDRDLQADLLVLDAHSGKLLHRLRMPHLTVPDDFSLTDLAVEGAGDGAVRVGWLESSDDVWIVT
ncbi:PQQ-binding-like beta-propeller repeat protein [Streptomyces sp. NPDC004579]|uniref:outer membrane protein assembly factor BamB family protein n=1 Tax=Streptomyces sp. NPDC004579 TaxID=3154667 RepID=UPI0033AA11EE